MPSPFPGMDPYLEDPARWPDVHQRLITYTADALQPQLGPGYYARMGERVYVVMPPHDMYPDVVLVERRLREPVPSLAGTAPSTEASAEEAAPDWPVIITLPPVEHREPFVEIVHAAGDEVVTIIEVLSPANKTPGEGLRQYRQKQQQILNSQAHLVEIDLLAGGEPTIAVPEESLASLTPHRYRVSVRRGPERHHFEVYPIRLTHTLPRVHVPLRAPDPDVDLNLPAVFTQCYSDGRYAGLVDYRHPPRAPLSAEEAAWVDGLLKGKGLRP